MGLGAGADDDETDLGDVEGIGIVTSPPRPPDLGFISTNCREDK